MLLPLSIRCNWNVARMCGRLTDREEIWIHFSIFTSCKITNSELQGPTFFVTDHKQFNSDFLCTSKCLFGLNLVLNNVFSWFYALLRFGVLRALKRVLSFMRGIPRRNWTKEKLFLETKNSFNVRFCFLESKQLYRNWNVGGDGQEFLAIRSHNSKVPHLTWRTTTSRCEGKYIPSHQPMEVFSGRSKVRKVIASLPLSSEGNFEWHISFAAYILLANAVSLIIYIYHFYPAGIPIRLWLFGIKMTVNTILRYVRIIILLLYFVVDFRLRFHGKRRQLGIF